MINRGTAIVVEHMSCDGLRVGLNDLQENNSNKDEKSPSLG
jgi:hypothetical protein